MQKTAPGVIPLTVSIPDTLSFCPLDRSEENITDLDNYHNAL